MHLKYLHSSLTGNSAGSEKIVKTTGIFRIPCFKSQFPLSMPSMGRAVYLYLQFSWFFMVNVGKYTRSQGTRHGLSKPPHEIIPFFRDPRKGQVFGSFEIISSFQPCGCRHLAKSISRFSDIWRSPRLSMRRISLDTTRVYWPEMV